MKLLTPEQQDHDGVLVKLNFKKKYKVNFTKYKFMRKYKFDLYQKVNLSHSAIQKTFCDFFVKIYKERLLIYLPTISPPLEGESSRFYRKLKKINLYEKKPYQDAFTKPPKVIDYTPESLIKLSFYGYWLRQYRLFTNFYNNLRLNVLKRLWVKARTGRVVSFNYFLTLLEGRVDSLLIRLNWVKSKHQIKQLLRKHKFLINDRAPTYPNVILKNFECLTVNDFDQCDHQSLFIENLKERLKERKFFTKPPYYLEVNHKTLTCLIIQKFMSRTHVKYPFNFSCEALNYISYSKR